MYSLDCTGPTRRRRRRSTHIQVVALRRSPRRFGGHGATDWRRSRRDAPTTRYVARDARPGRRPVRATARGRRRPPSSSRRTRRTRGAPADNSILVTSHQSGMNARTKIVATLGPASEPPEVLDRRCCAPASTSCASTSATARSTSHIDRLRAVREAARAHRAGGGGARRPARPEGARRARSPTAVIDARRRHHGRGSCPIGGASSGDVICVEYPTLLDDVHAGDRVVLGDGAITLASATGRRRGGDATVRTGGQTQGRPGVHLPRPAPAPVRRRPTRTWSWPTVMVGRGRRLPRRVVRPRRRRICARSAQRGGPAERLRLVAKIETLAAIGRLDEIAAAADAVMVARGDLGIECPLEDVPHLQKRIIRHCVEVGVPVITATQMMESMITAPSPTRAEVSDVANAVFDGTDAVDAVGRDGHRRRPGRRGDGRWSRIAERAEAEATYAQWAERLGRTQRTPCARRSATGSPMAITHAAWLAADDVGADGHPVLHPLRAHGAGDGPLPPGDPAGRPVAGPGARCRRSPCRGAWSRCRWTTYTTRPTRWSGSPSSGPSHAGWSAAATRCWSSPAPPTVRAARATDVVRIVASRAAVIWSRRGGPARRAAGRAGARLDGPLGRHAPAVAAGSTRRTASCATTGAATGARSRTPGPFAMDAQVDDLSSCSTAAGPCCSATATAATSCSPRPQRRPDLVAARGGVRGAAVSWPRGGRAPPAGVAAARRAGPRTPPSGSCAG